MAGRSPISLTRGTRFRATNAVTLALGDRLEGFVVDVWTGLVDGRPLARAVHEAAERHPEGASAFFIDDGTLMDSFAVLDDHAFDPTIKYNVIFQERVGGEVLEVDLDRESGPALRELLCSCASGQLTKGQVRRKLDDAVGPLFDLLLETGMVRESSAKPRAWIPRAGTPGVTRLQHACVLYRGKRAAVLVDPHVQSGFETTEITDTLLRSELDDRVDAIVISHSHGDHFHLPTLMTFPANIPIIVPHLSRPTMLCQDFAGVLRALGFTNVIPLKWNDPPFVVGDLEIHALPFSGEQPLVSEPVRHPDLRNQGNTYVVRSSDYVSWFLIDSGDDVKGRMATVAEDIVRRFGPVDFLLSNLRPFTLHHPGYITGDFTYWAALTPDQMVRFSTMSKTSITLGPKGVARACEIAKAKRYLPYAHWFGNLGGAPSDDETALLKLLDAQLRLVGAETRIVRWNIGDTYVAGRPEERCVQPFAP
jgi:L-ascorbate metabolism protein UlaG (beta-lactamase superfamily)